MVVSAAARIESGEDLSVVVFRHCRDVGIEHMTFVPSFWPTPQKGVAAAAAAAAAATAMTMMLMTMTMMTTIMTHAEAEPAGSCEVAGTGASPVAGWRERRGALPQRDDSFRGAPAR